MQMTYEPKKRFDAYSPDFREYCGLVTRQIQPPVKYGCPTNAAGLLGDLVAIDTSTMPPVSAFRFRDRNVSKEIHDKTFKYSMPAGIPFSMMKKEEGPERIRKYKKSEISPIMLNDNLSPNSTDLRILKKYLGTKKVESVNNTL